MIRPLRFNAKTEQLSDWACQRTTGKGGAIKQPISYLVHHVPLVAGSEGRRNVLRADVALA
jgi:hypothetical protein